MLNKGYGLTTNQEWFDKHVKERLDEAYPEELSTATYNYMKINPEINERITNGDWSHLNDGLLTYEEYLNMYEEVIKEMPKIDYERKCKEDKSKTVKDKNEQSSHDEPAGE